MEPALLPLACAQVAWKKWALEQENVSIAVGVAWWIVAKVFQPFNPGSPKLQAHVLHAFSTCYAHTVLRAKALYTRLWLVGCHGCSCNSSQVPFFLSRHTDEQRKAKPAQM